MLTGKYLLLCTSINKIAKQKPIALMKKALLLRFLLGNVEENFMTLVFESLSQMQRFSFQKRPQTAEDYSF